MSYLLNASCLGWNPSKKLGHFCQTVIPAGVLFQQANPSNVVGQYNVCCGSGVEAVSAKININV